MARKSLGQEFRDFLGSVVAFPADYFAGWFGVAPSESGVEVNELTAMQIAAFVGCVRVISGAIATLPFRVWEVLPDGSEKLAADHILDNVLNNAPNPETTAADFWETVIVHVLLTGNSYSEVAHNGAGQPAALYLRSPFRTMPSRYGYGQDVPKELWGKLAYKTNDTPNQYERWIPAENVVQVRGLGMDSLVGLSPVKYYAREVLGTDLAAQSYSAKFFANDSRPGGVLSAPGFLADDKKKAAVNSWIAAHSRGNSHTMAVLDGGLKWEKIGVNPEEAQFIQTRKFNREQIASIFGVPVHFLGESVESRANMEQRGLEFLIYTLKRYIAKIEQSVNMRMFPKLGRGAGRFKARMDTTMFERATYADLLRGIQMGRYAGLYTVDEGRKLLGEQPYTAQQFESKNPGDKLWQPVNMIVVTPQSLSGDLPTQVVDDLDKANEQPAPGGKGKDKKKGKGQGGSDQQGGNGGGTPKIGGTGQGGKRDAEIKRYFQVFSRSFDSALGRILARNKRSEKDFQQIFEPVLVTIAATFSFRANAEPGDMALSADTVKFIQRYIAALSKRAADWTEDKAVEIAGVELRRALETFREKCRPSEEEDEEEAEASREADSGPEVIELHIKPEQPSITMPITLHRPKKRTVNFIKNKDGATTGAEITEG